MADMILTPITELIIETLCSAAVKEIQSLLGVKDDLEDLERTLSRIKAVLLDAEKQQAHNNQVRDWLEKLEDVSYDADDLVDEVAAEGLLLQKLMPENKIVNKVRTFFSCCNQVVFRQKMAQQIKRIRKELAKIESDQRGLNLEVRQEFQLERNARETGTNVDEENIVGRDRDITEILKQLLSAEAETGTSTTHRDRVSVIPIIGMGGFGKTTLAQVVYNNGEVEKHFNLRLRVCVSGNVDNNPLIEKVVRSITNMSTKYLSMPKLEETIQENIKGQRLLLILDDVWKQEIQQEWERLEGLLGKNCVEGSRIVVTTRDDMVARVMGGKQPYHLGQLNPEDSWNLFKKKAFQHGHEPTDPTIFDIAKKILAKCGGVPLAISLIGSMLYHRDQKREWEYILENELSNLPHAKDGILGTLRLSYDCLPSSLKPCFAYCSLFPKNHEFDVQTLVTLWIVQGFIRSNKSQLSLEEIGYEYFEDLLWRSFFQEAKKDEILNVVKTCKMHDLVNDLATQVAGEKYAALASWEDNISRKYHVSFNNNDSLTLKEVPSSWLQAQRLRSFLFPPKCFGVKFKRDSKWDEVIPNVKFLRMLDLHDVRI